MRARISRADVFRRPGALRGQPRHCLACGPFDHSGVADRKDLRRPGTDRSGSTLMRPARSTGTPSQLRRRRSSDACRPHSTVRAGCGHHPSSRPSSSTAVTRPVEPDLDTPTRSSDSLGSRRQCFREGRQYPGADCTRITRAEPGSNWRKSFLHALAGKLGDGARQLNAGWPAPTRRRSTTRRARPRL